MTVGIVPLGFIAVHLRAFISSNTAGVGEVFSPPLPLSESPTSQPSARSRTPSTMQRTYPSFLRLLLATPRQLWQGGCVQCQNSASAMWSRGAWQAGCIPPVEDMLYQHVSSNFPIALSAPLILFWNSDRHLCSVSVCHDFTEAHSSAGGPENLRCHGRHLCLGVS